MYPNKRMEDGLPMLKRRIWMYHTKKIEDGPPNAKEKDGALAGPSRTLTPSATLPIFDNPKFLVSAPNTFQDPLLPHSHSLGPAQFLLCPQHTLIGSLQCCSLGSSYETHQQIERQAACLLTQAPFVRTHNARLPLQQLPRLCPIQPLITF